MGYWLGAVCPDLSEVDFSLCCCFIKNIPKWWWLFLLSVAVRTAVTDSHSWVLLPWSVPRLQLLGPPCFYTASQHLEGQTASSCLYENGFELLDLWKDHRDIQGPQIRLGNDWFRAWAASRLLRLTLSSITEQLCDLEKFSYPLISLL